MSSCKFLSNLDLKSYPIVIRMGDATFLATWDDTGSVGVVNLTKAELKNFATSNGSDKGEHIALKFFKKKFFIGILRTVRIQTRNANGSGQPCVQIETEI